MLPVPVRVALTTGIMGGFTTYSTFSYEPAISLRRGAGQYAALNIIAAGTARDAACVVDAAAGFAERFGLRATRITCEDARQSALPILYPRRSD